MTDVITIDKLESGVVVVQLKFHIQGNYSKTCDTLGSFCVQDFGIFPISVARILQKSKVSLLFENLTSFTVHDLVIDPESISMQLDNTILGFVSGVVND